MHERDAARGVEASTFALVGQEDGASQPSVEMKITIPAEGKGQLKSDRASRPIF
jgi:hypothetical protein